MKKERKEDNMKKKGEKIFSECGKHVGYVYKEEKHE